MITASKTSSAPAQGNGNPFGIVCPDPAQTGRLPGLFGDWFRKYFVIPEVSGSQGSAALT